VCDLFGTIRRVVLDDDDFKIEMAGSHKLYCFYLTPSRMWTMIGRFYLSL
jgi:hypothetical protein